MRDPEFRFLPCLSADLQRFHRVLRGGTQTVSMWRLLPALLSPRFFPVFLYRLAYWLYSVHLSPLAKLVSLVNFVIFGIEIGIRCRIGPGLILPHTQGTVIGATSIGADVTIFQGVTLGARELDIAYDPLARPIIGNGVVLGAGAKILGGIMLGNRCRVGANAVVLDSVPADAVAVGVPARIILPEQQL